MFTWSDCGTFLIEGSQSIAALNEKYRLRPNILLNLKVDLYMAGPSARCNYVYKLNNIQNHERP